MSVGTRQRALATIRADGGVDVEPRRRERAGVQLVDLRAALGPALDVFLGIDALHDGDHPVVQLAVAIGHREVGRQSLRRQDSRRPCRACRRCRRSADVELQMAEALVALGGDPAGQWIDPAGQRTIGMDGAAPRPEEHAAVVVGAGLEHGAAGLGVAGEELGRGDAEPARQPQRLVRPDPDRLVVAAPVTGVADVRERAVAPEVEVDPRYGDRRRERLASS